MGDEQATFNFLGLRLPWKVTLVVVLSTLLLMFDYYYNTTGRFLPSALAGEGSRNLAIGRMLLYLVVPMAVVLFVFREKPAAYGFSLGDWRAGLKWTLFAWAVGAPILFFAARTPAMAAYYTRSSASVPDMLLTVALDLFGWEFLFRGFILFTLYRVAGPSAVVLQAVPFALAHLGKPALETFSTIFGGTAFGWVAWRANSFLYAFLIHWYVSVFVIVVARAAS